jgi:PilZ domain
MQHTDANRSLNSDMHPRYTGRERRRTPRIEIPFPALVRGVDVEDQAFEAHTVLDNLSSHGLYLRLAQRVFSGMRLFVLIRLSVTPNANCIAVHGVVLRTEPRAGVLGTAIRFTHHRFIDAAARSITYGSMAGCAAPRDIRDRW